MDRPDFPRDDDTSRDTATTAAAAATTVMTTRSTTTTTKEKTQMVIGMLFSITTVIIDREKISSTSSGGEEEERRDCRIMEIRPRDGLQATSNELRLVGDDSYLTTAKETTPKGGTNGGGDREGRGANGATSSLARDMEILCVTSSNTVVPRFRVRYEEMANLTWDNPHRVRVVMKRDPRRPSKETVHVIQFTTRFSANRVIDSLSTILRKRHPRLLFTKPTYVPLKDDVVHDILAYDVGGVSFVFFPYPAILGCKRRTKECANLRRVKINRDERVLSFWSKSHFHSLCDAYRAAGFWRVKDRRYDAWLGSYGSHDNVKYSRWREMNAWQVLNHIPGSQHMSCKDMLAKTMRSFRSCLARRKETSSAASSPCVTPRTYVVPDDLDELVSDMKREQDDVMSQWISKPYAKSRGEGIELWNAKTVLETLVPRLRETMRKRDEETLLSSSTKADEADDDDTTPSTRLGRFAVRRRRELQEKRTDDELKLVVQSYISRPFLVDGLKFDCRIYLVATSFDPLCLCLYEEGLGRFATGAYDEESAKNVDNLFVHLTNSSVNKHSDGYDKNHGTTKADMAKGSKRSLKATFEQMARAGCDMKVALSKMRDAIIRVFVAYEKILRTECRRASKTFHQDCIGCYELFGIDVLFQQNGDPVVLELNYSPQIDAPMPMDKWIKGRLLCDTLHLVGHRFPQKRSAVVATAKPEGPTCPAKDHPKYKKFFTMSKRMPRPVVHRAMNLAGLDRRLLDTPDAPVSLTPEGGSICGERKRDVPIEEKDFTRDDDVDEAWLRRLDAIRFRQRTSNFECIFPVNADQVETYAPLFPDESARARYGAFAKKLRAREPLDGRNAPGP